MTERSKPLTVAGQTFHLRFDRADIKAIENALGVGYGYFIKPGIFGSVTAMEVYLWRGMRTEDQRGDLIHFFTLDESGKEQAGDFLMANLAENAPKINDAIFEAFVACGLYRVPKPDEPEQKKEPALKNRKSTGSP